MMCGPGPRCEKRSGTKTSNSGEVLFLVPVDDRAGTLSGAPVAFQQTHPSWGGLNVKEQDYVWVRLVTDDWEYTERV